MQQLLRTIFAFVLVGFSMPLLAEEEPQKDKDAFSWQAMLGVTLVSNDSILQGNNNENDLEVSLLLDVYYRGFFIQSENRRFDARHNGAAIGYRFVEEEDWEFDVLIKSYIAGFDEFGHDLSIEDKDQPVDSLRGIKTREYDGSFAMRYTRYYEDAIFWIDFGGDLFSQNTHGWLIDTYYSYLIPIRNWDIYLGAGVTIYSDNVVDYYYGIDEDEVTDTRPLYQGDTGARILFEAMVQYPISESWILRGGISQSFYSSSITDSPIVSSTVKPQASIEISYVF